MIEIDEANEARMFFSQERDRKQAERLVYIFII